MARLINADEIKLPKGFFEKVDNVPKFYEWLGTLHTVDAIEVVRCKDCKYASLTYDGECKYCQRWKEKYDGESISLYLDGDFYCAFGERREDETD